MRAGNAFRLAGSVYSPHARLLDNRLAYEVLETVYHMIPNGTRRGPVYDQPLNSAPSLLEYQFWVHRRLREAGLAKALAAGPDFLPDILVELPGCWRFVGRLCAPRNYRQLTAQVLNNLAWYLGEGTAPVTLTHKLYRTLWPAVVLTILTLITLLPTTRLGVQDWPAILFCALLLLMLLFGNVWSFGQDTSGRHSANCAELYAYLLESYCEPGPESENRVQSLLCEIGRDTDSSNAAVRRRARQGSGRKDSRFLP